MIDLRKTLLFAPDDFKTKFAKGKGFYSQPKIAGGETVRIADDPGN